MENKRIVINGQMWHIKYVSREEMLKIAKDDEEHYTQGITIYSKQTIYIDESISNPKRVLLHELTHAWLDEYGHNQHNKEWDNEDVCEIVSAIYWFLKDTMLKIEAADLEADFSSIELKSVKTD